MTRMGISPERVPGVSGRETGNRVPDKAKPGPQAADRAFPAIVGGFLPRVGNPDQWLAIAPVTTGSSTALRPSAPCSIVTVAFR